MPITQDRLIDLINVAASALDKLEKIRGQVTELHRAKTNLENPNLDDLFEELCEAVMAYASIDQELYGIFIREQTHFKLSAQRNNKSRQAMRRSRARHEQSELNSSHTDRPFLYGEAPDEGLDASTGEDEIGLDLSQDQNETQTETPTDPVGGLLPAQPIRLFSGKVGKGDGG